jgi:hypothetical protein
MHENCSTSLAPVPARRPERIEEIQSTGKNLLYLQGESPMTKRNLAITLILCITSALVGAMFAQAPVVNIDRRRHGNLAAAQSYIVQAYQRLDQAQQANEDQLGGHAQRAKDLLSQADGEIRLAANVANEHHR